MTAEYFMQQALEEAKKAKEILEVPIGAVIVKNGEIIGRGFNRRETDKDPTAHAEMIAIKEASSNLGGWRLSDCDMYVTVEPCSMCAGAIVLARIRKVYIGTLDEKAGACGSIINLLQQEKLNHKSEIEYGIMNESCKKLMKDFFKELRGRKEGKKI